MFCNMLVVEKICRVVVSVFLSTSKMFLTLFPGLTNTILPQLVSVLLQK